MALYLVEQYLNKSDSWYTHWATSVLEDAVQEYKYLKSYATARIRISKQITEYNPATLFECSYTKEDKS